MVRTSLREVVKIAFRLDDHQVTVERQRGQAPQVGLGHGMATPLSHLPGNLVPGVPNNPAFAGGLTMITFTNLNTFIGSPNFLPKFQKTQ